MSAAVAEYRPTKSLRDMTPEEREAHWKRVDEGMALVLAEMNAQARRSKIPHQCSLDELLRWHRQKAHCILVVRHAHRSEAAFKVSADGDDREPFYLPRSQTIVRPQTSSAFLLAVIPRWLHLKTLPLSNPPADLPGNNWTAAEREQWLDLRSIHRRINHDIETVIKMLNRNPLKRDLGRMPYGYTA